MRWGDAFTPPHHRQRLLYHYSELVGAHTLLSHRGALISRYRAHADYASGIRVDGNHTSDNPKGIVRMLLSGPVLNSFQKVESFRSSRKRGGDEVLGHLNLVTLRVQNREASLFTFRYGRLHSHELTIQRLESKFVGGCVHENTTVDSYAASFKILHRADPPFIFKWDDTIIRALIRSNRYYIICLKICIFTNSMIL